MTPVEQTGRLKAAPNCIFYALQSVERRETRKRPLCGWRQEVEQKIHPTCANRFVQAKGQNGTELMIFGIEWSFMAVFARICGPVSGRLQLSRMVRKSKECVLHAIRACDAVTFAIKQSRNIVKILFQKRLIYYNCINIVTFPKTY